MIKIILLISLISNYLSSLSPDKNNAVLVKEYEIKCYRGLITYKIINSQTKKYFLLIKAYYISEYALFEEDTELSYETYSNNDYYFNIKSNTVLYLVVQTYSEYCLSFKYMDTNYIILKENEEFLHPLVDYRTYIEANINNILNKHVILYFQNINTNFYLYINGKKIRYSDAEVYNFISENKESKIKLEIPNHKILVSIKYLSVSYSNIYYDTFKCIKNFNYIQSYIIKPDVEKPYFYISFSNKNNELYNENTLLSKLNYIAKGDEYFILSKNVGCFQIYFFNDNFLIENKKSYNILNSETYKFTIYNKNFEDILSLSIYSSQTNFLKQLQIEKDNQILKIKEENNQYLYNFKFYPKSYYIDLKINFNLNSQDYITITFEINYEKRKEETHYNWGVIIIVGIIVIFVICFFILFIIVGCYETMKEHKENKEKQKKKEMKLIETNEIMEKSSFLYDSIQKDYKILDKICLLCATDDKIPILNEDYEDNVNKNIKIDFIADINNEKYNTFLQYITPKICTHFYHDNCLKKYGISKNPEKCNFCRIFITSENMKKFGCFFSKQFFQKIFKDKINDKRFDYERAKREIIKNIENIFYDEIENSWKIDRIKKEKLLKLKQINEKYIKNFELLRRYRNNNYYKNNTYYKYYDFSIDNDLDEEENELNDDIKNQKKRVNKIVREIEEEEERKRPVPLRRCSECKDKCLFCGGNKRGGPSRMTILHVYKAHRNCIDDDRSCCICHKNRGTINCDNICYYCEKSLKFIEDKCYYCRRNLYND